MAPLDAARLLLAPPLIAIAAWFVALRRARPDLATRWLTLKVVALLLAIAGAAVASALGSPWAGLAFVGLADVIAYAVALRLWLERRPRPMSAGEAAHEARRHADVALDLADSAERGKGGP